MLLCKIAILSSAIRSWQWLSQLNSWRKSWKANNAARHACFFSADSVQTDRLCHLTKKTQEFNDVQLTDVYGSCVVELKRSWMQKATLLTTVYLCTTPIDFLQFHNIRNRNRGLTPCGRERHKSQTVSAQILILLTELFSVLPWSFMMSDSLVQVVIMSKLRECCISQTFTSYT